MSAVSGRRSYVCSTPSVVTVTAGISAPGAPLRWNFTFKPSSFGTCGTGVETERLVGQPGLVRHQRVQRRPDLFGDVDVELFPGVGELGDGGGPDHGVADGGMAGGELQRGGPKGDAVVHTDLF